jgi:acyl-CoA dehydrogenase
MDLVARKLPADGGEAVQGHIASLRETIADIAASNLPEFGDTASRLEDAVAALEEATTFLLGLGKDEIATALAGASAYTRLFGITSGAVYMAKGALKQARGESSSLGSAIMLARYYAENHAIEAPGLAKAVIAGGSWVSPDAADALNG